MWSCAIPHAKVVQSIPCTCSASFIWGGTSRGRLYSTQVYSTQLASPLGKRRRTEEKVTLLAKLVDLTCMFSMPASPLSASQAAHLVGRGRGVPAALGYCGAGAAASPGPPGRTGLTGNAAVGSPTSTAGSAAGWHLGTGRAAPAGAARPVPRCQPAAEPAVLVGLPTAAFPVRPVRPGGPGLAAAPAPQ